MLGIWGFLSVVWFLGLTAVGLPLLAGGIGGIAVFTGPDAGFLAGYLIASLIIGGIVSRSLKRPSFIKLLLINVLGVIVLYSCGIAGRFVLANVPLQEEALSLIQYRFAYRFYKNTYCLSCCNGV